MIPRRQRRIEIGDLLGLPYRDHGRGPDAYDCYGLAMEVERRMGKTLRDVAYDWNDPQLCRSCAPTLGVHRIQSFGRGALVEIVEGGRLHIGVCLDRQNFIHATRNRGVTVSPLGAYNIRGIYGID